MKSQLYFQKIMAAHEKMLRHIINGFEAIPALQDELFQDIALNVWQQQPKQAQDKLLWMGLLLVNSILILGYATTEKMQLKRKN